MAKLKDKTVSQLKAIAVRHFHKYIRTRDQDQPCISCGKYTTLQAGHFIVLATTHPQNLMKIMFMANASDVTTSYLVICYPTEKTSF